MEHTGATANQSLPLITPAKVHHTIQVMSNEPVYHDGITVSSIAEHLRVNANDLSVYLDVLHDLYYLKFEGRKKEKIWLTNTGKNTIVPCDKE